MSDFDIQAHLRNINFGQGGSGGSAKGKDPTNEETIVEPVVEEAGKTFVGFFTHLLHIDLGDGRNSGGVFSGMESDGFANKNIPGFLADLTGGPLARILHSVFLKNGAITNNADGIVEGAHIEAAHLGEGTNQGDYSALIGSGPGSMGDFDWTPASRADLGTYSPPNVGDAGPPIIIER